MRWMATRIAYFFGFILGNMTSIIPYSYAGAQKFAGLYFYHRAFQSFLRVHLPHDF